MIFDSSQTITAVAADHALKEFKSKIDILLFIPNLEQTLNNAFKEARTRFLNHGYYQPVVDALIDKLKSFGNLA